MKKHIVRLTTVLLLISVLLSFSGCGLLDQNTEPITDGKNIPALHDASFNGEKIISSVPEFTTSSYVAVNNNEPYFTSDDLTSESYEYYSELDGYGRCGVAVASIGKDLMPNEKRESIGSVKPSGWQTVKYDCVDGKYLYNRCHLIGFQLTGENANEKNLITGTRYLNVQGMLPFEDMVADYVKDTGNHVLYRVTPLYIGNNPVASGVLMEGYSVEDSGDGICYCVYCYNNQPGIVINYANGDSRESGEVIAETTSTLQETEKTAVTTAKKDTSSPIETTTAIKDSGEQTYVINTSTKKFHYPTCASALRISDENKHVYTGSRDDLIKDGYSPCGNCKP